MYLTSSEDKGLSDVMIKNLSKQISFFPRTVNEWKHELNNMTEAIMKVTGEKFLMETELATWPAQIEETYNIYKEDLLNDNLLMTMVCYLSMTGSPASSSNAVRGTSTPDSFFSRPSRLAPPTVSSMLHYPQGSKK